MGTAPVVAGEEITADIINALPVVVSYLSTGSVSNSTSETVIGSFTIPADYATSPGGFQWWLTGTETSVSSPTLIIRMRLNSVTGSQLINPTAATCGASAGYGLTGKLGFTAIGSSGGFLCDLLLNAGFTGNSVLTGGLGGNGTPISIDTTASNTLVVTAQWSAASSSNVASTVFGQMTRL